MPDRLLPEKLDMFVVKLMSRLFHDFYHSSCFYRNSCTDEMQTVSDPDLHFAVYDLALYYLLTPSYTNSNETKGQY